MAKKVKSVKVVESKELSIDTSSGSLAYNRVDMQVSHTSYCAVIGGNCNECNPITNY